MCEQSCQSRRWHHTSKCNLTYFCLSPDSLDCIPQAGYTFEKTSFSELQLHRFLAKRDTLHSKKILTYLSHIFTELEFIVMSFFLTVTASSLIQTISRHCYELSAPWWWITGTSQQKNSRLIIGD